MQSNLNGHHERVPQGRRRVVVSSITSGRYPFGTKPLSWDARSEGFETIQTADGETILLFSTGGQSTPAPGWELMLTGTRKPNPAGTLAECWTLYGIAKQHHS